MITKNRRYRNVSDAMNEVVMFAEAPPILPDNETAEMMLLEVNDLRAMRNLPPLSLRQDLECASESWAKNQWRSRSCSHTDRTRSEFPARVQECGGWLNGGYELIACGVKDFRMATGMWLRDLSSAQALLKRDAEFIGIGSAGSGVGGNWYVIIIESGPSYPY